MKNLIEIHGRKTAARKHLESKGWKRIAGTEEFGKNGERVKVVRYSAGWWRIESA